MNENTNDATTELLELAKASWNPTFLVPTAPDLIMTRPLMVLVQSKYDQPLSAGVDDVRQTALEQIEHIASFSQFIEAEAEDRVSVLFLAEFGDDPELVAGMYGEDGEIRVATNLQKALDLTAPQSTESDNDDEDEPLRPQHLWTIIVLPDPDVQHVDLESIQESIPDFTGKAYWYDPSDDLVKVQAWEDGDLDTGYLWAMQENEDVDGYTLDAAPGRALFAKLAARCS
jgi:hypothetical protein